MKYFWNPDFSDFRFRLNMEINLGYECWVNETITHWYESWLNIRYAVFNGFEFTNNPWLDYEMYLRNYVILLDSNSLNQVWRKWDSPYSSLFERVLFNPNINPEDVEMTVFEWEAVKEGWANLPRTSYDLNRKPF